MVIDGSWGTGKTEFCRKLIALVEGNSEVAPFRPVYIDAFRADHADQPLMTILAAILKLVPEADRPSLIKKAIPALRFGAKTAGKAAIAWLLKQDAVDLGDEWEEAVKNTGETILDKATESLLKDHMKAEQSIHALQDALCGIASIKPIVIFIDELDRCRPDFALSTLEIIKHVFNIKSVKFVLVTNTQQLKAAINHCYGYEVDAQRYLDKFLAFSFRLPAVFQEPNRFNSGSAAQAHFSTWVEDSVYLQHSGIVDEVVLKTINEWINFKQLSLREVETFIRHLEIYQALTNKKGLGTKDQKLYLGYLLLRVYAIYCVCFFPSLAQSILIGRYSPKDIADSLGRIALIEPNKNWNYGSNLLIVLLVTDAPDCPPTFAHKDEQSKKDWDRELYSSIGSWASGIAEYEERIRAIQRVLHTISLTTNGSI
ncbi:hypothetical protein IGB42_01606 [Andreprevotia sp. IGB-42]|nr:hypothetical protein IGB42_01606 [Andreprevotia sp. IGB-42]